MRDFTDLEVWKEAHKLTIQVYTATKGWPKDEQFGLISQVRRSVSSIGANIAEGWGRFNDREFHHFCNIARGSVAETRNHLAVALDLKYLPGPDYACLDDQAVSVARLLQAFMKRLRPD